MSGLGRFCCKSPLLRSANGDSVVVRRTSAAASDDVTAQSGPGRLVYSFCLDEVVPDDHLARKIASVRDLSCGEGEFDGAVQTLMGLRANESVLLNAVRKILLNDAGSLILPVRLVRRRPDPVALVFDGRCSRCVGFRRSACAGEAPPGGFE